MMCIFLDAYLKQAVPDSTDLIIYCLQLKLYMAVKCNKKLIMITQHDYFTRIFHNEAK